MFLKKLNFKKQNSIELLLSYAHFARLFEADHKKMFKRRDIENQQPYHQAVTISENNYMSMSFEIERLM